MKIYLASQSPRRQELLRQLGVEFELLLADPQEDAEILEAALPGESPTAYVQRVTRAKAHAARERMRQRGLSARPILVADTTVALGRTILGKPHNAAENLAMLHKLSGKTHRVLTAIAVVSGRHVQSFLSVSRVTFCALNPRAAKAYAASGEGWDKAGGYAIQGKAGAFVMHISGSYSGIVGLPLAQTATLLNLHG
ncbi:MAG: Maf family protein [Burkholderiaceae bacterium]